MHATVLNGTVVYLGPCEDAAREAATVGAFTVQVNTLEELVEVLNPKPKPLIDELSKASSDAFNKVVEELDKLGVNKELADKVRQDGEKLVAEVRSLGARGIKAVGEGFVALGDLLKKVESKKCDKTDCCGGSGH